MTHINAYFQEVQEKEQAVSQANAELEGAKSRLEAKKREIGFEEPKVQDSSAAPASTKTVTLSKKPSKKSPKKK